jgi:hypothetical protein
MPQRLPLWRLVLVIIGVFWFLAAATYGFSEWVAPAILNSEPSAPSGFNYGQALGAPFIKTFGLWVAGILFVLGAFAAVWRAIERGADSVMATALGTRGSRSGRR